MIFQQDRINLIVFTGRNLSFFGLMLHIKVNFLEGMIFSQQILFISVRKRQSMLHTNRSKVIQEYLLKNYCRILNFFLCLGLSFCLFWSALGNLFLHLWQLYDCLLSLTDDFLLLELIGRRLVSGEFFFASGLCGFFSHLT